MKIISSKFLKKFCILFLTIAVIGINDANAQRKRKKRNKTEKVANSTANNLKKPLTKKGIKRFIKNCKKIDGLLTIYQDTINGNIKMLVRKDQLNKEFIHFSQITNGVTEVGAFKGSYRGSKIFYIKKYFNKLEFIQPNTSFYFDKKNPISRASKTNISDAVLASIKILATNNKKDSYLIDINGLFLSETFTKIKPSRPSGKTKAFFGGLGSLNRSKSKINAIKNYQKNTNIEVEYVYSNSTIRGNSGSITDSRNISIKVFHTIMSVPSNNYKIRYDDPRVGFFTTKVTDMTTTKAVPYRDLIHRWRLIKKDPNAPISEPITPITWWIENTTPIEFRETIKEGVLAWNKAFEKAGFKKAIVVKIQPDNANWDADDVRYNVLRWSSSPKPRFGGYGPSFVNPRTGEILGADIMLEYAHFTNRVKYNKIYNSNELDQSEMFCSAGNIMHDNNLFGQAALSLAGASDLKMEGMKKEAMKSLVMHEIGHTLGLMHNMKASHLYTPDQLANRDFTKGKCLTASVMDYDIINITNDRSKQGQYYDTDIGPYDIWAIQFGYSPFKSNQEKKKLLQQSTKPELIFGNDADDMRYPGKGIDPRVMVGTQSSDEITYSINRIKLVNHMMKNIKTRFTKKGQSYQELKQVYNTLEHQYSIAAGVISRFIGGVYVDRAMAGQLGGTKPYTPVSLIDQKRAIKALKKYVFAPNAFRAPKNLYNYIASQRRGFNFLGKTEDPKIHAQVLDSQIKVLSHILHKNTLERILDSELYGNKYKLSMFMTDLNNIIFKPDIYGNVNSFRQNLQTAYTKMLINIFEKGIYPSGAKAMALYNLKNIKTWVSNGTGNISTKAHKNQLKTLIVNAIKKIK